MLGGGTFLIFAYCERKSCEHICVVSLHPRPRGPQEAGAGTEKRLLGAAREGGVPSKRRGLHALSDEVLCNKGRDGSSTKVGILFFFLLE